MLAFAIFSILAILSPPAYAEEVALTVQCTLIGTSPKGVTESETYPSTDVIEGMKRGREKAADWWGHIPGTHFELICVKLTDPDKIAALQKNPAGSGHSGLSWEKID